MPVFHVYNRVGNRQLYPFYVDTGKWAPHPQPAAGGPINYHAPRRTPSSNIVPALPKPQITPTVTTLIFKLIPANIKVNTPYRPFGLTHDTSTPLQNSTHHYVSLIHTFTPMRPHKHTN